MEYSSTRQRWLLKKGKIKGKFGIYIFINIQKHQRKIHLHYIRLTKQLSFKTTNLNGPTYRGKWFIHGAKHRNENQQLSLKLNHYNDVIMGAMASQITSLTIVYSTVYSGAGQRKHQSSASLASVRGIHRWPVNSPHKKPVTRKMFPFDDVIMLK